MSFKLKDLRKLIKTGDPDLDISELLPQKEIIKLVSESTPTEIPIPEGECAQFRHSVNIGDLVAAMGCVKKYYEITGRKAIILQTIGYLAQYYTGAEHPIVDESGRNVTVNQTMFDMAKPLIESQNYVHSIQKYSGQNVHVDFDVIRGKTFVNLPHGTIQGWLPIAFPDLAFDISQPWITLGDKCPAHIKGQVVGKVLINFTARYRAKIDYYFLQGYAPDLIFSGTEKEHWDFCNQWGLNIPRLEIRDFLELAYAIREARFFLGNQSMAWNLAQSMGTPRLLEMCNFADNCFPGIGKESYGYFYQVGAEHYFRLMYNKTINNK